MAQIRASHPGSDAANSLHMKKKKRITEACNLLTRAFLKVAAQVVGYGSVRDPALEAAFKRSARRMTGFLTETEKVQWVYNELVPQWMTPEQALAIHRGVRPAHIDGLRPIAKSPSKRSPYNQQRDTFIAEHRDWLWAQVAKQRPDVKKAKYPARQKAFQTIATAEFKKSRNTTLVSKNEQAVVQTLQDMAVSPDGKSSGAAKRVLANCMKTLFPRDAKGNGASHPNKQIKLERKKFFQA